METDSAEATAVADQIAVSAGDALSVDVLAKILGYLDGPKDILQKRRVCKKWKEAVKKTIVPISDFCVASVKSYNAMAVMTEAMPNLQQIKLGYLGRGNKYSDGEDPNERRATNTVDWTSHDIEIISNFSKLQILDIYGTVLNGRYPFLFHSFPLLEKLSIIECSSLKWDLEMIAGLPLLKELMCYNEAHSNKCVTGNINSLRVLKDTFETLTIDNCPLVEGNLMDLADFPHLKELHLPGTAVTGDIRDINTNDFSSLEYLAPPKNVYGGWGYELQRISDAPDLMRALNHFNKKRPNVIDSFEHLYWTLIDDSPEWYESVEDSNRFPFGIKFVKAGSRVGYRWESYDGDNPCEVNWLDPEPDRESNDYAKYIEELQEINSEVHVFRGFHQPPSEEEYNRLCEEFNIDD